MAQQFSFPTAQTVLSQALAESVGSSSSGLTALQTTALLRRLDAINRQFVNSAHTMHQGGAWSWMQDVTNFETVADTTLSSTLTSASASFTVTSSGVLVTTGGRLWVKTAQGAIDFVDYASSSSTTASTPSDVDVDHASAEECGKCYPLPSDYGKHRSLVLNTLPYDMLNQVGLPVSRTFYTRGGYLVLPEDTGATDATLWYEKRPTSLSTGDEAADLARSMDVPVDFQWYAVHMLKAYIHEVRRRREDAASCLALAQMELDRALNYDISESVSGFLSTDY